MPSPPLTYSNYLKIDELLRLQEPRSEPAEHDETLFIVIHQVYELWFFQIIHELDRLNRLFRGLIDREGHRTVSSLHTLKRVLTILKTLVAQIDVLETMTPMSFASFRERLESASGFQSWQFRELEFLLGKRDRRSLEHHREDPLASARLEKRLAEPSLYQAFLRYLERHEYAVPEGLTDPPAEGPLSENTEVQKILIEVYHEGDYLAQVCERLVDLDEGFQEWRYRHVKMVERTIGTKTGTGGSPGAAYLRSTLFQPLFPDLWAIRTEL